MAPYRQKALSPTTISPCFVRNGRSRPAEFIFCQMLWLLVELFCYCSLNTNGRSHYVQNNCRCGKKFGLWDPLVSDRNLLRCKIFLHVVVVHNIPLMWVCLKVHLCIMSAMLTRTVFGIGSASIHSPSLRCTCTTPPCSYNYTPCPENSGCTDLVLMALTRNILLIS